jgi:hypothetical protein
MASKARPTNGLKRDIKKHGEELRAAAERSKEIVRREVAQKQRATALKSPRLPAFPLPRESAWDVVPPSVACTCLPTTTKQYVLKTLGERIETLKAEACRAGCKKTPSKETITTKNRESKMLESSRDYLASIPDCS